LVWRLGWILFGFAAATLMAALVHVPPAAAQGYTSAQDPARAPATQPRSGRRVPASAPSDPYTPYETPAEPPRDDSFSAGTSGDGEPGDASGEDPASPEAGTAEPGPFDTSVDPESSDPAKAPAPADGTVDLAEPVPPQDGDDPTRDTRPPADREPFESPPAGFDPLLYQIEDIDPVETDRRPERLARFEPYDPIGIRVGSFVFFPEIELAGLSTSNVLSSPHPDADIAGEIRTSARLVSNWSAHALELRATTLTSYYDDFPSEDDRAWSAEARGRIDVTHRTNFQGIVRHDLQQEDRQAIDANNIGPRPDVTTDQAQLAFNHRFNRLSIQLRGSVADTTYSETDGQSNDDRDTLETRQAVRATWEFKPTLAVFGEQELVQRDKDAAPSDGIPRDSEGYRTRLGLDFGSTGAVLRGTISVGYGEQSPDDHRLRTVDAFLFDANLAWRPTEITSFFLTAQSDIYDTTTTGSGGVASRMVGFEARHALRRYLIASAGLTYTNYDYDNVPTQESALVSFAGAEYYASPELVLFTRYQHLSFASNQIDGDYDTDEIRVGARLRK
jgi:hypothetical protein